MSKYLGLGVTLQVDADDTGGGGYSTVGQVVDINGPEGETDDVEVTTRDSADTVREFLGGWITGGEVTLELVYDPALASHATLASLHDARTEVPWQILWPSGTSKKDPFRGYVKRWAPAAPLEGRLSCNVTIKTTKKVTKHAAV